MNISNGPAYALTVVAEDAPLIRLSAANMLAVAGMTMLEVSTVDAALVYLECRRCLVLLLTDIQTSSAVDSVSLAYQVVRRWPSVAIVACSSHSTAEAGLLPVQTRFIDRPFSVDLVVAAFKDMGLISHQGHLF